jgi:hypothetical protein
MEGTVRQRRLVLVTVCCLFAFNGLNGGFVFDDNLAIVRNEDTSPNSASFLALWSHDIWGKSMLAEDSHHSYRPLLILTFKVLRMLWDAPMCLKIVSVTSHCIATCLFYSLSEEICGLSDLAYEASLLFAAHPVHVESVTAVVNMAESIHCIFYILAFLTYLRRPARGSSYALWFACVLVSSLFKETGVTVVGVILARSAVDLMVVVMDNRRTDSIAVSVKQWRGVELPWWGACVTFLVLYALFRLYLVNALPVLQNSGGDIFLESSMLIRRAENPYAFLTGKERALSLAYLHYRYMRQLLFPYELCAEYSFDCIPSVASIFDPRTALSCVTYLTVVAIAVLGLLSAALGWSGTALGWSGTALGWSGTAATEGQRKAMGDKMKPKALLHALVWLIVPFIPASGVFLRLGTLLAERLLYVPSLGFCLLLAMLIRYLCSSSHSYRRMVVWGIVGLYVAKSYQYNRAWHSETTLFFESLRTCPNSAKHNLQVAKIYVNSAESSTNPRAVLAKARYHVDRAKDIDPRFCDTGYQEAMLQILYHQNATAAIEALVDNLDCVYTARNSLVLLEQLWESQLTQVEPAQKSALLRTQAKQALGANMSVYSAQKYVAATQSAMDQKAYLDAIELSKEAESIMTEWFNSSEAEGERYREGNLDYVKALEVTASVKLRGGVARRVVQILLEGGQTSADEAEVPQNVQKELLRAKEMLFSVLELQQQGLTLARSRVSSSNSSDEAAYESLRNLGVNFALSAQAIQLLESMLTDKVNVQELLTDPAAGSCRHGQIDHAVDYVELMDLVATSLPHHVLPEGQRVYDDEEMARMWAHLGMHYVYVGDKDRGARYLLRAVKRNGRVLDNRLSLHTFNL